MRAFNNDVRTSLTGVGMPAFAPACATAPLSHGTSERLPAESATCSEGILLPRPPETVAARPRASQGGGSRGIRGARRGSGYAARCTGRMRGIHHPKGFLPGTPPAGRSRG